MPARKVKAPAVSPLNINLETYFQSDEIFKNAFLHSAIGMALVSLEGNWLKVNNRICDIVGYSEDELLKLTFQDITHPDDLDLDLKNLNQMLMGKIETFSMEKRYICKDGEIVWVLLSVSLAKDTEKKPLFFISQVEDINEQKLARQALEQSEFLYRDLVENTEVLICTHDMQGNLLSVNDAALKLTGSTREDLLKMNLRDVLTPQSQSDFDLYLENIKKQGNAHGEMHVIIANGETRVWEYNNTLRSDGLKEPIVRGMARDVTEQKLASEALQASEERYHSLFEDSPISLWEEDFSAVKLKLDELKRKGITDFESYIKSHPEFVNECSALVKIIDVNNTSVKLFNAKDKTDLTTSLNKLLENSQSHKFEYELINIAKGITRFEWEEINKKLTGEVIHIRLTWYAIPGHEEDLSKVIISIIDITESKQIQQELQKSEENYKNIIENMPAILYMDIADEVSSSYYISPQIEELLGYPSSAYIENPKLWHQQIEPQDYETAISTIQETLKHGKSEKEYRLMTKDGQQIWVRDTSVLIRDENSKPKYIQGFIQNISEEKLAKDELQASEERYKSIVEDMPMMMCRFKPDGTLTFINAFYCQYFKKSYDQLIGINLFDLIPKAEREVIREKYLSLNQENSFVSYEYKTIDSNGKVNWQKWTDRALFNEKGEVYEYQSIGEDITEQKRAEEKLRKSEEHYRKLTENFPNGTVNIYDRDLRLIFTAGGDIEKFNVKAEDFVGKSFQEISPPETFMIAEPYLRAAFEGKSGSYETEYWNDQYYYVNVAPLYDADGNINEILVIAQNITEQKQANIVREESEKRYRSLFEDSPISLWEEDFSGVKQKLNELKQAGVTDFEAYFSEHPEFVLECASVVEILNVNKASVELFNAKGKEDLTTNMRRLLRSEDIAYQFKQELLQIANGHTHFEREAPDSKMSGEPLTIAVTWSAVPGHEEDLARVIISILDITERKKAEEERRILIQELGERLKELTYLHNISRIFMDDSRSEDETLQAVADAMPAAWQYPEITAARVGYNGYQYITPNFKQTDWMQSQFFDLPNGELGFVQVAYLEEKPEADEGPFLYSERFVLESTVEKLRTYLKGNLSNQAINRQLAELETLYESGLAISQLLTPQEIAQETIGALARKMKWNHIAIREYDAESNRVKLIGFSKPGISPKETEEYISEMNRLVSNPTQGLSGWATTSGKSIRVGNVKADVRYIKIFAEINSGIYVPLKIGERVIGSISVESEIENAFTEYDERLLVTLAGQAAIAIENANLFRKLQTELLQRELAENEVRQLNAELENRVEERTVQIEATKRRLELATHAGHIGVWEYIPRENKVIWDERMHIIHHVPKGEFNGTPEGWSKYIYFEDLEKSQMNTQLAFTQTLLLNNEHRIVWPDGTIRYVATSAITVFAEDNIPDRIIGISVDITDRKNIEHSLKDSEAYARLLFDAAPDSVFVMEVNGTMVDVNKFFEFQHQIKQEDLQGKNISELNIFPPDELQKVNGYIHEILNRENIPPVELKFNAPEGDLHTLELHSYPIEVDGRQLVLSTSRDITTHKKLEEALKLANTEMENALQVKDEFLANMSHELRTPLNAILGISESLEEQIIGKLNDKQFKYVGIIKESGRHLLELINDILDISKIEAGRMELDFHQIGVEKLCQASLRMIKELAQKKNIKVSFKIKGEVTTVMGDERRLKQVLVNLLSNAVKFTEEGEKIGLEVVGYPERNEVTFSVWDTGIGIAEENLKYLFKPFVQLDAGLAREYQGTGLGLALVAQMVRLHGGLVSVKSEVGKGSMFIITLPWEPDEQNAPAKVTGELVPPRIKSEEKRKEKVLLVEDTDIITALVRDYLNYKGYEVITAQNGREGILFAKEHRPDIILMDVMMPIMDGVEATVEIRKVNSLKETPIIALTALAMPGDRERCMEAGMTDYMSKPVKLNELIEMIEKYAAQG